MVMSTRHSLSSRVWALPLWAALLPLLTFNLCYVVAISLDHLPVCIPYISGCTSASSTGRLPPESWLFKAGMLPLAVVVLLVWWRCAEFLERAGRSRLRMSALRVLGVAAALSLLLYTLTLGVAGTEFGTLRRIGINGFALSNFIAQLIFVLGYRHLRTDRARVLWQWLAALCVLLPTLAIAAELAKWFGAPRRPVNNVMAWNALLLQSLWFIVLARLLPVQSDNRWSGRPASPSV
jgi:hypothetical protein